jgi:hypothetical protein
MLIIICDMSLIIYMFIIVVSVMSIVYSRYVVNRLITITRDNHFTIELLSMFAAIDMKRIVQRLNSIR